MYFFQHKDHDKWCFIYSQTQWVFVDSAELQWHFRPIIGAVAEVAWRKEAEKWATTPVNDCKNFDDIAAWKAEAEANALAWRKWSLNEPWEDNK